MTRYLINSNPKKKYRREGWKDKPDSRDASASKKRDLLGNFPVQGGRGGEMLSNLKFYVNLSSNFWYGKIILWYMFHKSGEVICDQFDRSFKVNSIWGHSRPIWTQFMENGKISVEIWCQIMGALWPGSEGIVNIIVNCCIYILRKILFEALRHHCDW